MHGVKRLFSWMIPRFDPDRFRVSLVSLRKKDLSEETLEAQGVDITYLHRSKFDPLTLRDLLRVIDRQQIDVLHLHGYGATTFGRMAAALRGLPAILHEHANLTDTPWFQKVADYLLEPCTDIAIAVSKSTADFVIHARLVPASNPEHLLEESLTVVDSPQDVYGTAQLGIRFRDDKQDLNWAYVPALRRVREVSPANRSDGFLGSDISQDDGSYFDGKVSNFDFKLVGEGEMLCVADPVSLEGIYPKRVPSPQYPGGWRDFMRPDKGASGFMKADWKGVPWAPADQALVLRPVWILELVPKDRYYLYGKIQLSIDKLTWEGCYNRKWSWQGEQLHDYTANHNLPLPQKNADGTVDYFDAGLVIFRSGINFKLDRASNVNFPADVWIDRNVKFPANWFDYQSLSRFGK